MIPVQSQFAEILSQAQADTVALQEWSALSSDEKNNRGCVDFTGLQIPLSFTLTATDTILVRDEEWEHPFYEPDEVDSLVFQCVAKNVHGLNPDGKFYMYYCQHDSWGGIGCAVADVITGPYVKLKILEPERADSQILKIRDNHLAFEHYSSPQIAWNSITQLWHLYFHFYHWNTPQGGGWQHTTLATCPDLSTHEWTLYDSTDSLPSVNVLAASQSEHWRNALVSYAAVCRLPNNKWFAAVRANGATIPEPSNEYSPNIYEETVIGVALSDDGKNWLWHDQNPVIIHPSSVSPLFVGYFGSTLYLLAYIDWAASASPRLAYTRDFQHIEREHAMTTTAFYPVGMPVTAWREGNNLYLFGGHKVYTFAIG